MPQQVTFDILSTYCLLGKKKKVIFILAINGKANKNQKSEAYICLIIFT